MSLSEDIHQLESRLERQREDLREDVTSINEKVLQTRAQLSPNTLMRDNLLLLSGAALVLGFALGYRGVPIEVIGKPVARRVLTNAGRQAATRALMRR
jgi:hypothetical protein